MIDRRLGLQDIQLALWKLLREEINDYLPTEQTHGEEIDSQLEEITQQEVERIELEHFDQKNIHYGHRPSLIEAPVTNYPSMAVAVAAANPATVNQNFEYGDNFQLKAVIELIVKSGPYSQDENSDKGDEVVGRRLKRTVEAIHHLLNDNRALGGAVTPSEIPPNITEGEIFIREEEAGIAGRFHWQGARMEYTFGKQTTYGS